MGDIVRGSSFTLADLPAPELRKDPVTGRWTIFSTERARRPDDRPGGTDVCPFCAGHESETPPAIARLPRAVAGTDEPGWRVRVIPNRYPALRPEGRPMPSVEGLFESTRGIGRHEVIIECPAHEHSLARLPVEQFRDVVTVWRDRVLVHASDRDLRFVKIFKNKGAAAGASLEHSHSQLLGLPVVPGITQEELGAAERYFEQRSRCVFCELVRQELAAGRRVVSESRHFVAATAFAGRWPFETWVLPKAHASRFEHIADEELADLAATLHALLNRFERGLCDPPYNLVLHTAPLHLPALPYYHWHLELLPRLTQPAGFEWGTGWHINPVPPEQAATFLRGVETEPPAKY